MIDLVKIRERYYVNPQHIASVDCYLTPDGTMDVSVWLVNRDEPIVVRGVEDFEAFIQMLQGKSYQASDGTLPYISFENEGNKNIIVDTNAVRGVYLDPRE